MGEVATNDQDASLYNFQEAVSKIILYLDLYSIIEQKDSRNQIYSNISMSFH